MYEPSSQLLLSRKKFKYEQWLLLVLTKYKMLDLNLLALTL